MKKIKLKLHCKNIGHILRVTLVVAINKLNFNKTKLCWRQNKLKIINWKKKKKL